MFYIAVEWIKGRPCFPADSTSVRYYGSWRSFRRSLLNWNDDDSVVVNIWLSLFLILQYQMLCNLIGLNNSYTYRQEYRLNFFSCIFNITKFWLNYIGEFMLLLQLNGTSPKWETVLINTANGVVKALNHNGKH